MKRHLALLAAATLGLTLSTVHAQPGPRGPMGMPPGPHFGGHMSKLFGNNPAYSATLEFTSSGEASGKTITMVGKIAYLDGKSRYEMDMSKAAGANMPPQALASMKQMGMEKMIMISRPDIKTSYMIYPAMNAYVQNPTPDSEAVVTNSDYKVDVTGIGSEAIEGHPCVKNKVVVTGPDGTSHESTVWNATDMNKFPLKIEAIYNGTTVVMLFKDLKLDKPDAAQFDPPADCTKYDSIMNLMMSRAGGQPRR